VTPIPDAEELATRLQSWRLSNLEATCDVIAPWEHGLVVRSSRYPYTYAYNAVLVDRPSDLTLDALVDFVEEALGDLTHRRLDFLFDRDGAPYRTGLESRGWDSLRTVWMRHEGRLPDAPEIAVEEVSYDATIPLRQRWHEEDFPGVPSARHFETARELALSRDVRIFAVVRNGAPIAYAQIEMRQSGAEVSDVYVSPENRGQGLGTALASHATRAAPAVRDLWIAADAEDRPRHLYARLGYRPVHHELGFVLVGVPPSIAADGAAA
jgi:GNAT superfamily N-acetyltransferase